MKKIIITTLASLIISGCAESTPPVCYNKANIDRHDYDIPVFKVEGGRYMAGYPFYNWADKSQFVSTEECDKLNR